MIPITVVKVDEQTKALVNEVLDSGSLAQGPMVQRFENLVAEMAGTKHAVAMNNGTTSLVASLQALGVGPGDELITSPFTFVASVNAALEVGASVRFADIDPLTFNMDPQALAEVISENTKVVMPVHLYGQMADMPAIAAVARRTGSAILEDSAQAHGASIGEQSAGKVLGSFSFYATKNISTGEGGAVTTDDDQFADRLRLLRNQGMRRRYEYEIVGYNYRMTDLQAAIGIPQMERIDEIIAARRHNADRLTQGLTSIPGISPPVTAEGYGHVFHQYTVRITSEARVTRDEFVDRLTERAIGCGIYYPRAAYDYDCYRDHPNVETAECPKAERAAAEAVSLPVHPHLSESELDQILQTVSDVLGA